MKPGIHPEYNEVTIACACGTQYATRSCRTSFSIDICSACHPFFTGKQRILDTAGRVERFRRKYEKASTQPAVGGKKAKKAAKLASKQAAAATDDAGEA